MHNDGGWGHWFRDSFDKLILLVLVSGMLGYVLWLYQHPNIDSSGVQWARELTGTFAGALIGLITGARMAASAKIDNSQPGQTTVSAEESK